MSNGNCIEKYVYILGAGFSAPLGIPVMKNFLSKAKDQFSIAPKEYEHFSHTFNEINKLHECAYHYDCDIGNIEEILSILLTLDNIKGTNNSSSFKKFIKDVIEFYTPDKSKLDIVNPNCVLPHIKNEYKLSPYAKFVSSAFNFDYSVKNKKVSFKGTEVKLNLLEDFKRMESNTNHSFITLNYDLVLETVLKNINQRFQTNYSFCKEDTPDYSVPCLAKIHGCISDSDSIIPPTWNKGDLNPANEKAWKLAGRLLHNAHHIIIIGYSLPETDSYIKYLLKSSCISDNGSYTNLKSIKVFDKFPYCKEKYVDFIKNFSPEKDFYEYDIGSLLEHLSTTHCNSFKNGIDFKSAIYSLNSAQTPYLPKLENHITNLIDKRIMDKVKPL